MDIEKLLSELTLEEKVSMLAGNDHWTTVPIERLGIPQLKVTDGPNGARGGKVRGGTPGICFPCGSALASTWNTELVYEVGTALADQVKSKGAHILLAPTVNIHRTPIAGRNFECYSEDPYLTGEMAVSYVGGLQDHGVGACIKHFVANDQEYQRNSISAEVDDRSLHEIYLEPFRTVMARAMPWAVMSSYNRVNGTFCSEDKALLIDLLKEKWGFDGIVMSDWFGTYSDNAAAGGLDLEMPGKPRWMGENVLKMVQEGTLDESVIDDKVKRLLRTLERVGANGPIQPEGTHDSPEIRALVRRAGSEAIVLLKNEDGVLPLQKSQRIAVIGANAKITQFQGGGSAHVTPTNLVSPLEGIRDAAPDATIVYGGGCTIHKRLPLFSDIPFELAYYNQNESEPVHTATTHSTQIAWFGDLPYGVEDGFTLTVKGEFTAPESGTYQFGLAGVGECMVKIGSFETLSNYVNPESVTTPFEMWDQELIAAVDLEAGQVVEISAEYKAPTGMAWKAMRLGHLLPQPADPIGEAVEIAKSADVAIVVAGLNDEWESEGFDRIGMDLPGDQDELIARVAAANPNTIVVLNVGSAVHMPWVNEVAAVLQGWYLGQEQGNAIADVLFGDVNPSAKLPTSFPVQLRDNPAFINYPGEHGKVRYGEGLFVGYRYYDRKQLAPLFPFGHGLSYTSFAYDNLQVSAVEDGFDVTLDVKNAGERAGSEIVQLYLSDVQATVERPDKELKGFAKVSLAAGETKQVALSIKRAAFAFYNPKVREWVVEAGDFDVLVGASAGDIRLQTRIVVEPDSADSASLNINLPLGTLMEDERGLAVLTELMPELLTHPMLDMAKGMTLLQIQPFAADQLTDALLAQVDLALKNS